MQLKQLQKGKNRAWTGFESMTSAMLVYKFLYQLNYQAK